MSPEQIQHALDELIQAVDRANFVRGMCARYRDAFKADMEAFRRATKSRKKLIVLDVMRSHLLYAAMLRLVTEYTKSEHEALQHFENAAIISARRAGVSTPEEVLTYQQGELL